ncbi:MAG: hypothetical protein U9P71_07825 [Campylobacterota bacterium]|nr:hypothetical protein [Campylobacterota bacterium]
MLENSLWHKYSANKTIQAVLAALYDADAKEIAGAENELYAILKRQLTKRELRLFIMNESGITVDEIKKSMQLDDETFEAIKKKVYRKFKIDKLKNSIFNSGVSNRDTKASV